MEAKFTNDDVISFINPGTLYSHCLFYDDLDNKLCQNKSNIMNGLCFKHQKHLEDFDSTEKIAKRKILDSVKKMLVENETTVGKENKEKICTRMFDLLSKNRWFLYDYPKFAYTVFNKLLELEQEETTILDPLKYVMIMFPNYNMVQIEI